MSRFDLLLFKLLEKRRKFWELYKIHFTKAGGTIYCHYMCAKKKNILLGEKSVLRWQLEHDLATVEVVTPMMVEERTRCYLCYKVVGNKKVENSAPEVSV
jgi:hypothetical protein